MRPLVEPRIAALDRLLDERAADLVILTALGAERIDRAADELERTIR